MTIQQQIEARTASTLRWGLGHALPRVAIRGSARRGDLHGRLIEAPDQETTLEVFDLIRASGPLHRAKFAYVTASQPVVKEVLTSPDMRSGIDFGPGGPLAKVSEWAFRSAPMGPLKPPSLLVTEPPDHTRYRKLVTRVFSVKAVQRLRERTQTIADELLDQLDPSRPVDLVEAYCSQLPVTVIAEILGVPEHDHGRVLAFGQGAAPSLDLGLSWRSFRGVESSLAEFQGWLDDHIESVRRSPGDDLLSQLVTARDEHGAPLSDDELRATAGLVLAAGFETTVNLLGNGIQLLHDNPEQLAHLRDSPDAWPNAVDEALRLDPPVLLTGRMAARDTQIAGTSVPRGTMITTLLAGANRDPEVFTDPGLFDVTRSNANDHVSFSSGRHYCLGAALARMEGEVGLRTIFERFPDLQLHPGATRRSTRILRGFETLPATLSS